MSGFRVKGFKEPMKVGCLVLCVFLCQLKIHSRLPHNPIQGEVLSRQGFTSDTSVYNTVTHLYEKKVNHEGTGGLSTVTL